MIVLGFILLFGVKILRLVVFVLVFLVRIGFKGFLVYCFLVILLIGSGMFFLVSFSNCCLFSLFYMKLVMVFVRWSRMLLVLGSGNGCFNLIVGVFGWFISLGYFMLCKFWVFEWLLVELWFDWLLVFWWLWLSDFLFMDVYVEFGLFGWVGMLVGEVGMLNLGIWFWLEDSVVGLEFVGRVVKD